MLVPKDAFAFTDAMADVLRLPDETLAMSYLYLNKYLRFHRTSQTPDPLDSLQSITQTLALATLSLSAKSTESPRRLSSILLPADALLHPPSAPKPSPPLRIPSPEYDILRATLVHAELLLLRILGFELRIPSPLDYLARYLERAMENVESVGEDYDGWGKEEKEEYGVVSGGLMEGKVGRGCRGKAIEA
ncbi:MAG: hypothetical protein Q9218_007943, partial [Villophora microphyllina]